MFSFWAEDFSFRLLDAVAGQPAGHKLAEPHPSVLVEGDHLNLPVVRQHDSSYLSRRASATFRIVWSTCLRMESELARKALSTGSRIDIGGSHNLRPRSSAW